MSGRGASHGARPGGLRSLAPLLASALLLSATGARARVLPAVFPHKQLLVKTDEFLYTRSKRPGDGTRHRIGGRLGPRWIALSQDRRTFFDEAVGAIRRVRDLDNLYIPARDREVLRMNNQYEFCAWAKDFWVEAVEFIDLGFTAGRDDCPRDLDFYMQNQHPENDEWLLQEGVAGEPPFNPFAGRPESAVYGDYFEPTLQMLYQVPHDDGSVTWEPLAGGGTVQGGSRVRFQLAVRSDDILPLRIHRVLMVIQQHSRESRDDETRLAVLGVPDETIFPVQVAPGASFEHTFPDLKSMLDLFNRVIRIHVLVDYEDPFGEVKKRRVSTWYWKGSY